MSELYLTAYSGKFLGPIAIGLGWIMDKIYMFFAQFGIYNIALTIIVFTIFIYLCLFPLTYKQQKFSVLSQKMQPELNAIQKKYKGKKDQASVQAQQEETQAVYDKYGVSAMGSCVQLLIQMPILFALYRVFYNIPAYITSVKSVFTDQLVGDIVSTDGFSKKLQSFYKANNLSSLKLTSIKSTKDGADFALKNYNAHPGAYKNKIVDVLYRLSDNQWESLKSKDYFSNCSDSINAAFAKLQHMNYIGKLCISDTPWNIMKDAWSNNHDIILIICAILIPVLSYLTQVLNIKLSPASNGSGQNDQMAQQMKMMNKMMPLMSLFICFTVPVGLGVYWIAGAVVRCIQQYFLNKHFEKINLEDIIEQNKEKAAKKKEKRQAQREMITQNATINTKSMSMSDKAGLVKSNQEALDKAAEARKSAPAGSMTAMANLVKDYNERNNK